MLKLSQYVELPRIIACALVALFFAGCASISPTDRPTSRIDRGPATSSSPATERAATQTLQRLVDEAAALKPYAESNLSQQFLSATRALPVIATRTAWINELTREYFSAAGRAALSASQQSKLSEVSFDEFRYYYTKYGSPLAYIRPLDFAAANGVTDVAGKRILDFGYGSIGHLRLLASLGAHVTGVDPDSYLSALYTSSADQGAVPPAATRRGHPGTVTLAHGYWPKDTKLVQRVGGGFDLILSKNTLKKGYIKPEHKIEKRQQIDLGVSDDVFIKSLYDALNPGGKMVIYNIYPKPAGPKEKYNPQADARSPWPKEQYERAGFQVLAFNVEDHAMIRNIARTLNWDRNDKGDVIMELNTNLFALVTILAKPPR